MSDPLTPITLRNVPPDALKLAQVLSAQTGLSLNAVLRLALVSGLLVEATKVMPDSDGKMGGLEAASLAKALRRHISSAIDLLVEHGQHPYQGVRAQSERVVQESRQTLRLAQELASLESVEERSSLFENAIGDDLAALGIGMSLAETVERTEAFPTTSA